MQSTAELEQFSTVVEKIYDAAIDTARWDDALVHIASLIGATATQMYFGDLNHNDHQPQLLFGHGLSEKFKSHTKEFATIWAIQTGMLSWLPGEVHHLPDIMPREEFLNSRFYKEVIQPENQLDYIGMLSLREGSRYVPLALGTSIETGPFPSHSVDLVRLLAPHICKSAKIGLALELKTLNANLLESTLNALRAGVYLVNRDGKILFMNRAAEQQIKHGRSLAIINNRIAPKDESAAHVLSQSLNTAEQDITVFTSLALPDEAGGMVATLLPLENGQRQNLSKGPSPAAFAVFVQDPAVTPPVPGEAFARLYQLTPAELRVSLAMAPGLSPQGTADILGLSLATVKSHLQHIFAKTGTTKQAELMQLLMRASAPVGVN